VFNDVISSAGVLATKNENGRVYFYFIHLMLSKFQIYFARLGRFV